MKGSKVKTQTTELSEHKNISARPLVGADESYLEEDGGSIGNESHNIHLKTGDANSMAA